MADYLTIAGRIKTSAADGVSVEAQEIKDLLLDKSQQEVNADVQTELGDRYTKEETYSKEQLDSLITSPDVSYVTVVATDQTTDVTDLLPATGADDTIYRVGNWDGTQYDTTVFSLYAWDGTDYVCLAVRSFVGEVYDISANHPDGQGNPTTYADLTAALGTDGANVPSGIRRGGMSIKFIQTSDNNYVQYRYMLNDVTTTATFTNPDNWLSADGLGQGERYFTEPCTAAKKLVELYLTGLNDSKSYYISNFRRYLYSGNLVNTLQISEVGGGVVAVLGSGSVNTKSVTSIIQNGGSGITGYAIFNLEDGDSAKMTGKLNSAVVSSLDMSPSIKEYLGRKGVDEEPTQGSHNLVESGGVVKYLKDGGYLYKGIADLSTVPPTLDNKYRVFYVAKEAGTYTNFNNTITLAKGEVAFIIFNGGVWYKNTADIASISYLKNTLLSYPKTQWIKNLSSATILVSGTSLSDDIDRDVAISKLNSYIRNVESINYSGYLTIAKFGVSSGNLILRLWFYNTLDTVTVSEISQKHDVTVSAQALMDNNFVIYDSIPYTSSAFRIVLDPSVINFMGGGNYAYNADSQVSFKYSDSGFTPKDVTNRAVIDNGFSRIYKYGQQYVKHLWDYNDALLSIEGLKEEYIYNISKFGYIAEGRFGIVIDYATKNQTNEITAENYNGEISFTAETSIVSLNGIMRLSCKDTYGNNILYVTVDFDKLDNTIYLSQYSKYGNATIIPKYSNYVFVNPVKQFNGYYNGSFNRVENNTYVTCIISLNAECKESIIRGTFDANANVLLADSSGRFKREWGIKNQDESKYSGNDTIYNCVIDCTGYKFLIVSSQGTDVSAMSIQIEGYNADKAIDSYNSLRFAADINTKDIHLFRAANVNGNFVTSCDKSCRTFQLETSDIANGEITDSVTGFVYDSGLLLEVAPDGTKYYYAVAHSTGNNSILWKDNNGTKTVILRGGDTIPQATGYATLTWVSSNSAENLSQLIFVKILADDSVLVGTNAYTANTIDEDTGKTIIGKYYVVFKITGSGWVPKIITSNQKTYRPNLGYFIKTFGYPTKNNSISTGWNSGKNIIAISEYGYQTPQYWYDRGQDVNGLGVSGKVWVSIDNGKNFYKVFDLDEKINGDADDISDDNWKWCTSYAGRQGMHLHCCYIDQVNNKLWITNGDGRWPDSKNSLYYIDLATLVKWITNSGTPVDVTNFNPLYEDNEALPEFREFKMFTAADNNNAVSVAVNYQFYCMIAINNCLVLGNDSARQIFYVIHGDTIVKDSNVASNDMFIDIAYEIDKNNPSLTIETFPQLMFRKNENSMIISLWSDKGVYGSWNGVDWSNLKPGDNLGISFTSYLVKDTDGKYIICTPSTHSQKKLENY